MNDYYIRHGVDVTALPRRVAMLASLSQIAMVVGTAIGGVLLLHLSFSGIFVVLMTLSVLCFAIAAAFLPTVAFDTRADALIPSPIKHKAPASFDLSLIVMMYLPVNYAVGQVTNVLIPGFIQLCRRGSSLDYALLEASWSLGALLICAGLVFFKWGVSRSVRVECLVLCGLCGLLSVVPRLDQMLFLAMLHGLMGALFAFTRVRGEAQFLILCPMARLGRRRGLLNFFTQSLACAAFALPLLLRGMGIPAMYDVSAALLFILATSLYGVAMQQRARACQFDVG